MFVKVLLVALFVIFMLLLAWSLCRIAARSDSQMDKEGDAMLARDAEQLPDEAPPPAPYINSLRSRGFKR